MTEPYSRPPKAPHPRFLSTPGSCQVSLRFPNLRLPMHLPNLQQVWLYSPNLQQVWLFLPHLQQVWLTQDQLGAFLAVLSAAPSAAPSATLPTALYLLHKIRTYDARRVARKTSVFFAPIGIPTRSPRVHSPHAYCQHVHRCPNLY